MTCCSRNCNCRRQTPVRNTNDNFIFSAVEVVQTELQTVETGNPVLFNNTVANTGVSFTYENGNEFVNIIASGVYKISFVGSITTTESSQVQLALASNDTAQLVSTITQNISTGEFENVKTEIILKVISPPNRISVLNTGNSSFNIQNAMLSIVRIGDF